ncbi:hypothetical protein RB597_000085 [Gaeumannomyces tritici]
MLPKPTAVFPLLLCLAAAAPQPATLLRRSYTRSCDGCALSDTHYLHCYCWSAGGRRVETEIDLDWCVTNSGGELAPKANGAFSKSCSHERWDEGTTNVLVAYCGDGRGGARDSKLDLNDFVHNSNGILSCHGIAGVEGRVPGGPNCPHPHTIC